MPKEKRSLAAADAAIRQARKDHRNVRRLRCFGSLPNHLRIRVFAVRVISSCENHVLPFRCFAGADGMRHVDMAGSGALVPGALGKLTDKGNFLILLQRQDSIVFHQHCAFAGKFPRQSAAGIPVDFRVFLLILHGFTDKGQQPQDSLIQIGF